MVPHVELIIPARNEYPWLPWTVYSFVEDAHGKVPLHVTVVSNGGDDEAKKMDAWFRGGTLAKRGHLSVITIDAPTHPYRCIQAVSDTLPDDGLMMYTCGHTAVQRDTVPTLAAFTSKPDVGLVHSPMLYMGDYPDDTGTRKLYGYKDPVKRGWSWHRVSDQPYMWSGGGGGLSCVKVRDWRDVGGTDVPFRRGIGGCEQFIDMKLWMFGKSVWIHPDCLYWHWAKSRNYVWKMGEHYWNDLVAYYCLAGRGLMEAKNRAFSYPQGDSVLDEVEQLCQTHRKFILDNAVYTLDEVLEVQPWQPMTVSTTTAST